MRLRERKSAPEAEGDMTPMIDMTFQLIAFFMVLINFTDAAQHERVVLPESILAKPPDEQYAEPRTVQLTSDDKIVFEANELESLDQLYNALLVEKQVLEAHDQKAGDATVIIRAHRDAKAGRVQEIIQKCQDAGFQQFALRAKQAEIREESPSS